jgi:hypothetical protein
MKTIELPKFNRQKFLLILLEQLDVISTTDFQHLIFLSHQEEKSLNYYDFVQYDKKWLSFQAAADLDVLKEKGWILIDNNNISLQDKLHLGQGIKKEERWLINRWAYKYKNIRGDSLIQLIDELNKNILIQKNNAQISELFTIGYEGSSLEEYLNKLIKNNIQVLYDVRKNPLSRKFGFSKSILSELLPQFGIEYRHLPELGIVSEKRQDLNTELDYIKLFAEYEKYLPEKIIYLQELAHTLKKGKSIALTCFEKTPRFCHRHCVSNYLTEHYDVEVTHL